MNTSIIPEIIKEKLLEHQRDHIELLATAIKKYNSALDASDTGTGKTYVAVALAAGLNLIPFIICPKSVIASWHKVLKYFNITDYYLVNYETLKNCNTFKGPWEIKMKCPYIKIIGQSLITSDDIDPTTIPTKKEKKTIYEWSNIPENMILIFDEVHRCKNKISNNSELLTKAADAKCKILMLSATVAEKINAFVCCGYALGLYNNIKQGRRWIEHCGTKFNINDNPMMGVHMYIFNEHACRMRISLLGDIFQKNTIIADCYEMENAIEIQKMYELIKTSVEDLRRKENQSEALAKLTYARMRIEVLKIPKVVQMAKDFCKIGKSIAIFTNFTDTINLISTKLKTNCIVYGEQKIQDRNNNIEAFNSDKERIILCNIKSGGVGISLHDTVGKYPRIAIVLPSYSAQDMLQALGRINRAGGKSECLQYILFCKNTIEEQICENIKCKIMDIGYLNDGNGCSYKIKNMIEAGEDNIFNDRNDQDNEINKFDKLYLQISVLNAKRNRVKEEMEEIDREINKLQTEMEKFISY